LRFLGQLKDGIYDDPADQLDLETLHEYYGVTRKLPKRFEGETGAGNDDSEDEDEEVTHARVIRAIGEGQEKQIRHPPIEVPEATNPFMTEVQQLAFFSALNSLQDEENTLEGFDLNGQYEPTESYKTGRSRKGLRIPLPHSIWFPRIVLWCRAITLLQRLSIVVEEDNRRSI
jgi:hypothetical protein